MVPAFETLVVRITVVARDDCIELTTTDRFKYLSKSATAEAHARPSYFLSLDNQKVAASRRFGRACARVTVNRSPDSPARERMEGGKLSFPPPFRAVRRKVRQGRIRSGCSSPWGLALTGELWAACRSLPIRCG